MRFRGPARDFTSSHATSLAATQRTAKDSARSNSGSEIDSALVLKIFLEPATALRSTSELRGQVTKRGTVKVTKFVFLTVASIGRRILCSV